MTYPNMRDITPIESLLVWWLECAVNAITPLCFGCSPGHLLKVSYG